VHYTAKDIIGHLRPQQSASPTSRPRASAGADPGPRRVALDALLRATPPEHSCDRCATRRVRRLVFVPPRGGVCGV